MGEGFETRAAPSTAAGALAVDALVLAGGRGSRLGGVSKADLELGGRLLDRVLDALRVLAPRRIVVVAPESVAVPSGVLRTAEEPCGGGPLAGIGAGLEALGPIGEGGPGRADRLVVVVGVDTPGLGDLADRLFRAGAEAVVEGRDGAIIRGGDPEPFDQFLQGAYSARALGAALDAARRANGGSLHGCGVRRALHGLDLVRVEAGEECRDLDDPEDLAHWRALLA
ncbi:NTP transferase domain-containing protein [Schaalia hyovaginalis]|uniref:Molybdopterin-guanine dinucleotide biosynthesis protein A n=1 Tax=Schaalia hyovaginalis TaxID=29316 RepID=A0A923E0S0_9ACTO|nr:NTP transferase domain-containing protein [Schaalia hyovaginalis]MBB6333823.1 molybdopterin-guanine dinucleotide biosynthesis protein A [Schaalia hyovaginalis]MDY2668939.1 NTP transferase domain-containing protein [Schaalia hyovaginalis]